MAAFAKLHDMRNFEIIALVSIGVTLTMIGDVLLKRSHSGSLWLIGGGLLFYSLGCAPVILVFRLTEFGNVFVLWEALTVVLAVVIGHFLFGESVTSNKLAAVGLVICAILVLNR
jgi:multidrug transporter EmrE-like cation transporter